MRKNCVSEWICFVFFLFAVCVSVMVTRRVSTEVIDDDAAAELILADVLNKENHLITDDFFYSLTPKFFLRLTYVGLFKLFDGWHNVRFFGSLIWQGLLLLSFAYMMNRAGRSRRSVFLGCGLLLLPYCVAFGRVVLYHNYYAPPVVIGFFLTGLFFSMLRTPVYPLLRITIFVLLALIGTLDGLRMFTAVIVPLCGAMICFVLRRADEEGKTVWKKWMLYPLFAACFGAIGVLLNGSLIHAITNGLVGTAQTLAVEPIGSWGTILAALLAQFGFRSYSRLNTPAGLLSIGGLFAAGYCLTISLRRLFDRREKDFTKYCLYVMPVLGIAVNLCVFILGQIPYRLAADYSRYLVLASLWFIPLLSTCLDEAEPLWHPRRILYWICIAVFLGNGIYNVGTFMAPACFPQPYDGLSYDDIHLVSNLRGAAEWLDAHDYSLGYAVAGNCGTLTEMTNGRIQMVQLTLENGFPQYKDVLCRKSIRELPAERVFLLLTEKQETLFRTLPISGAAERLYFDDNHYVIYEYSGTAVQEFRDYLNAQGSAK